MPSASKRGVRRRSDLVSTLRSGRGDVKSKRRRRLTPRRRIGSLAESPADCAAGRSTTAAAACGASGSTLPSVPRKSFEQFLVSRQNDPFGRPAAMLHVDARRFEPHRARNVRPAHKPREPNPEFRFETCTATAPSGSEMLKINVESLLRQQMNRNRIAAEGVEHQHVELLRRLLQFPFQRQPGIAQHDLDRRASLAGVGQIGEVGLGQRANLGIDFVEPNRMPGR